MRPLAFAALVLLGAAAVAGVARAETVSGEVRRQPGQDGTRPPVAPGTLVYIERVNPPEGAGFATGVPTDGVGRYQVDLEPGFEYRFSVPRYQGQKSLGLLAFDMLASFGGGPIVTIKFPSGVVIPPGPPTTVDLDQPPGGAVAAPCVATQVAPDLLPVAILAVEDPVEPVVFSPVYNHESGLFSACYFVPRRSIDLPVQVKLEFLDPPARDPVVGTVGIYDAVRGKWLGAELVFEGTPLAPGERYRVSVDLEQPVLATWAPISPVSYERTVPPSGEVPPAEFWFHPAFPLEGRAFVERTVANGVFDGDDVPLPGLTVRAEDAVREPGVAVPPMEVVTDAEGRFVFPKRPLGYYNVSVVTPGGAPRADFREVGATGALPVAFAYVPSEAPHLPCDGGPLHQVTFDAVLPVGDPTAFTLEAELTDGCDGAGLRDRVKAAWTGAFPGPATGPNGVVEVVSVAVVDGLATVRLRCTATGGMFPAGFFGDVRRRVAVTLNGRFAGLCTPLGCDTLSTTSLAPPPGRRVPVLPLAVVETWSWDSYRRGVLAQPCVVQSASAEGGLHHVVLDVPVFGPLGRRAAHTVAVTARCGWSTIDAASALFSALVGPPPTEGPAGILTILGVSRTAAGTWVVRIALAAPDRPDLQPGALPACEATLRVRVDRSASTLRLDLGRAPVPGPMRPGSLLSPVVVEVRNTVDEAGCR